jgi:hypothetical protein
MVNLTRRHLLAAGCAAAFARTSQAGSARIPVPYSFRFEWLDGGTGAAADAYMDLGSVAANPAAMRTGHIVISRRVAVRVDGPGPVARLSVTLLSDTPGCTLKVDGLPVSTMPRVVEAAHRVGSPVVHRLEITIPRNVPPGAFLTHLQWLAEPA